MSNASTQAGSRYGKMLGVGADEKAQIVARIKGARERAGLYQRGAADALGVSVRAYQTWEHSVVPWPRIQDIAALFGVKPEWILYGDQPAPVEEEIKLLRQEIADLRAEIRNLAGSD